MRTLFRVVLVFLLVQEGWAMWRAGFLGFWNSGPPQQPVHQIVWVDPTNIGKSNVARPSLPLLPAQNEGLMPFIAYVNTGTVVYTLLQSNDSVYLITVKKLSFQGAPRVKLPCNVTTVLGLYLDKTLPYPDNLVILCAQKDTEVAPLIAVTADTNTGAIGGIKQLTNARNTPGLSSQLVSATAAGGALVYRGATGLNEVLRVYSNFTATAIPCPGTGGAMGIVAIGTTGYLIDFGMTLYSFPLNSTEMTTVGKISVRSYGGPITANKRGAWVDPENPTWIVTNGCARQGRGLACGVISVNISHPDRSVLVRYPTEKYIWPQVYGLAPEMFPPQ
eukprot:TRINITY_DN42134_c0_g1_i1.p1 TRINITY_DN42134_c0_g1~~TRINITY_DN42134_c0_g1_i1.p1  ORF type:complete len:333 (+),score=31.76 TRINITY_DN42134_c0_g1_i1:35-1033(+)